MSFATATAQQLLQRNSFNSATTQQLDDGLGNFGHPTFSDATRGIREFTRPRAIEAVRRLATTQLRC